MARKTYLYIAHYNIYNLPELIDIHKHLPVLIHEPTLTHAIIPLTLGMFILHGVFNILTINVVVLVELKKGLHGTAPGIGDPFTGLFQRRG